LKVAVYVRVGVRRVGVRRVGVRRVGVRRVGVRRVHVALCSAFPLQGVFRQAARRLGQSGPSLT
jgi:hypothetical protein